MTTLKQIVETRFPNEKTYNEYYRKDAKQIIAKLIKYKDQLEIDDTTINQLNKLNKLITYSAKKEVYEQKIDVYNKYNTGRFYVKDKPSLQSLPSKIKNTLIDASRYVDFDIVNSAPSILLDICRIRGWKCEFLTDYCNNRDKYIKNIIQTCKIPRKPSKRLFISMMFGGDYVNWAENMFHKYPDFTPENIPDWVRNIHDELFCIMDNAYHCDDFSAIKKNVLRKKKLDRINGFDPNNPQASVLANILFNIENVIIQRVEEYITTHTSFKVDTPAFDGFNLRLRTHKNDIHPPDEEINALIETTQDIIKTEYDLNIKFSIKNYGDNFISQLRKLDNTESETTITLFGKEFDAEYLNYGVMDEHGAMKKLLDIYPHFKICEGELYMYQDGLWTNDSILIKTFVSTHADYIMKLRYNQSTSTYENSAFSFGRSISLKNYLMTSFRENGELVDNNLLNTYSTMSSRGKLLFHNGVLYADENGYVFRDSFDEKEIFKSRVEDDFRIVRDEEKIDTLREVFFTRMYQDNADTVIKFIACALFGLVLKKSLFIIGRTNSGKSLLTNIICKNFSSALIGNFKMNNFMVQKFPDADTKHLKWVVDCAEKRLIISNESFIGKFDCELFKQVCSGGVDAVQGRALYKDHEEVLPKFMMLSFMNPDKEPIYIGADEAFHNRVMRCKLRGGYVATKDEIEDETTDFLMEDKNVVIERYTSQPYKDAMRWLFIDAYVDYMKHGMKPINILESDEIGAMDDGLGYIREILQSKIKYSVGQHITSKEFNDWVFNSGIHQLKNTNVKSKLMKELYAGWGVEYSYKVKRVDGACCKVFDNVEFIDE